MIITSSPKGIDYNELATLKELATMGALREETEVTTGELADRLDVSPQTISRRLRELEEMDTISRNRRPDGQTVFIKNDGVTALEDEYEEYRRLFTDRSTLELTGVVTTGVGEGEHFVSLPGYAEQFVERLGYEPYPGTFNLHLDERSARKRTRLERLDGVEIEAWESEDRTYGAAVAYPATLENTDGEAYQRAHVLVPERTHHGSEQLELIAPDRLRAALDVDDDAEVNVRVVR